MAYQHVKLYRLIIPFMIQQHIFLLQSDHISEEMRVLQVQDLRMQTPF